jgi:hypothetical protein
MEATMQWTARAVLLIGALWLWAGYSFYQAAAPQTETLQMAGARAACRLAEAARGRGPENCPPPPFAGDAAAMRQAALIGGAGLSLILLGLGLLFDQRRRGD